MEQAVASLSLEEQSAIPQTEVAPSGEAAQPQTAEDVVMIEVWRPGRSEGRRRPHGRHRNQGRKPEDARKPSPERTEAAGTPVAAAEVALSPNAAETPSAAQTHARPGRPPRHRRRPDHRQDRPPRERERPPVKRFERREKVADPNSPFAKLAALKAQLEADAKERR